MRANVDLLDETYAFGSAFSVMESSKFLMSTWRNSLVKQHNVEKSIALVRNKTTSLSICFVAPIKVRCYYTTNKR